MEKTDSDVWSTTPGMNEKLQGLLLEIRKRNPLLNFDKSFYTNLKPGPGHLFFPIMAIIQEQNEQINLMSSQLENQKMLMNIMQAKFQSMSTEITEQNKKISIISSQIGCQQFSMPARSKSSSDTSLSTNLSSDISLSTNLSSDTDLQACLSFGSDISDISTQSNFFFEKTTTTAIKKPKNIRSRESIVLFSDLNSSQVYNYPEKLKEQQSKSTECSPLKKARYSSK